jgi:hypothetical protein
MEAQMAISLSGLEFIDDSTPQLLEAGGITTVEQLKDATYEGLRKLGPSNEHFDALNLADLVMALENAEIELSQFPWAEAA